MYIYEKGSRLEKTESKPVDSVQIDIISDLHLDFYLSKESMSEDVESFISNFRRDMKQKDDEVVIVAGDISGNNELSKEVLSQLSDIWKHVLVIPGNHDWYLQVKKTEDRYSDLIVSMEDNAGVAFLMDKVDIFEHNGVKIAGTIMFYNLNEVKDYAMWKALLNDNMFIDRKFIIDRNRRDVEYYSNVIDDVDIFVSHIPIVNLDGRSTTENLFLNMDVKPKEGVLYLSGHTHKRRNSVDLKSEFDAINVSYGYPSEIIDKRNVVTTVFTKGF